jgi:hypothetical protein
MRDKIVETFALGLVTLALAGCQGAPPQAAPAATIPLKFSSHAQTSFDVYVETTPGARDYALLMTIRPNLSASAGVPASFEGRRVGVVLTDTGHVGKCQESSVMMARDHAIEGYTWAGLEFGDEGFHGVPWVPWESVFGAAKPPATLQPSKPAVTNQPAAPSDGSRR